MGAAKIALSRRPRYALRFWETLLVRVGHVVLFPANRFAGLPDRDRRGGLGRLGFVTGAGEEHGGDNLELAGGTGRVHLEPGDPQSRFDRFRFLDAEVVRGELLVVVRDDE